MYNILIPTHKPVERNPITSLMLFWFLVSYFMTAMGAYNVGPVPASWLAQSGMIVLAIGLIMFTNRLRVVPGGILLILFFAWALYVTTGNLEEFSGMMPRSATTPYGVYITLRYVGFTAFIASLYLTYWLIGEGEGEALVRWIVLIAFGVSVVALYIYLAHMFDLPEPTRSRLGTGGAGQQAVKFSSEGGIFYNRATGTFREPSGLAEWLILPLFLSFAFRTRADRIRSAAIAAAFSLTLSMMGLFAVAAGTFAGLLLTRPFSKRTYKVVGLVILAGAVLYFLLSRISVGILGENRISVGSLLGNRVLSTLIGGIGKSNRQYVYDFVAESPWPAFGYGIGNGNLMFAKHIGVDSPAAFLSVYLFTLYAAGYPGIILLGGFLFRSVAQYVLSFKRTITATPLVLMAYIAYLVSSAVGAEELSPWFGISAGLITWEAHRLWTVRRNIARLARAPSAVSVPAPATGGI